MKHKRERKTPGVDEAKLLRNQRGKKRESNLYNPEARKAGDQTRSGRSRCSMRKKPQQRHRDNAD